MRDLLTGLAIILIVVLTTLLVAPYFVDWNGQRGFLESQLSRALGQKVTIGGNIDLKLLPTPYLRLNQTVIGSDDGAVRVGIRHLDLELNVTPLLHGEFDIVEGRLDEPTIRLTLQTDRNLPTLPDTPALRANIRLERMRIVDGTLAVADPQSGHTFVIDHLDFSAEAPSLAGPFRGSGSEGPSTARTKFRFSTTAAAKGKTRLHLTMEETPTHPGLDLDGDVALSYVTNERVRQSFDGTIVAVGHISGAAEKPIDWRLSGPVKADPQGASFDDGELRIGGEDNGLTLPAAGDASFGEASDLHLRLNAKQLDIDRLSGAPVDATRPPPPKLPDVSTLKRLLEAITPPLPTFVDVTIGMATWGGEALSDLTAHVSLGGPAPRPIRLSGGGPGGLHLDLRGTFADSGAFGGHLKFKADDIPASLRWVTAVTSARVPTEVPFRSLELATRLKAEANDIDLLGMSLSLGQSKLTGSAHVALGDKTQLAADLKSPHLDLDSLPNMSAIQMRTWPVDVTLKLDADAVRIAQVGNGPLTAGHAHLDTIITDRQIVVNAFEVDDLGGARLSAKGTIDATSSLAMTLDATHLDRATALAQQLAPGRVTDALASRAADLSPAKLKIDGSFGPRGNAKFSPLRLDVTGQVAQTRLDVHLVADASGASIALRADAEATRGAVMLRQLGVPTFPIDAIGPSHVRLAANGRLDRPLNTQIDARFGDTGVTIDGSFDLFAATGQGGSGTMTLKSADIAPLLQTLALAPVDMTERLPAGLSAGLAVGGTGIALSDLKGHVAETEVAGTLRWQRATGDDPAVKGSLSVDRLPLGSLFAVVVGPGRAAPDGATWSNEPFAAGIADPPRSAITLRAKMLDLGFGLVAEDAGMDLGIGPNLVTMRQVAARLRGGQLGGDVSLRRDGAQVSLEGSLAVDKVTVALPPVTTTLTGKLDFAGGGSTPLALASSLAGTGQAILAQTKVAGVDTRALPSVFASIEDDTLALDDDSVARAFAEAPAGSLDFGARHFAASLAGGTLSLTAQDQPVVIGPIAATFDGSLDLRQPRLELRVGETLQILPKNWTGSPPAIIIRQVAIPGGPPRRGVDISNFINAVAARAIAHESARIESYEFDIRERELFNARLDADRRREQDRLKADSDAKAAVEAARKAEADRRAKAEAARLERQRQDRNAKALPEPARGQDPQPPQFDAPLPGSTVDPAAAGRN